jgi:hypothetical protein
MPPEPFSHGRPGELSALPDAEWVMAMRALLAAKRPTVAEAIGLIGTRTEETGGATFLRPQDKRFSTAHIVGRAAGDEAAVAVRSLSFFGTAFAVRPSELARRLPLFESRWNTWDGGKFFFFHPLLPNAGQLSGVQLHTTDDEYSKSAEMESVCHRVEFEFGSILRRYRDGYGCQDPEDAFPEFARRWFTALADGRAVDASEMLNEPNSYDVRWTPESIQAVVAEYGARAITHPDAATGTPRFSIVELADGSGFSFDHNVPLDGSWSDLAAQFDFLRRGSWCVVALHDLHVL